MRRALLLALAFAAVAAILTTAGSTARLCTHGVSSVGPVVLVDGKLVTDATPHTEACLP